MPSKYKPKFNVTPLTVALPVQLKNIENLVEGTNLCPDRIKVFLHQIYASWVFNNLNDKKRENYFHKNGWVTLSVIRLKILLTQNYSDYENFLEGNNIIEIKRTLSGTKSYVAGYRCTPYRINPILLKPINGRRFKQDKIHTYKALKAIKIDQKNFNKELKKIKVKKIIPFCEIHKKMNVMLSNFYFDLDKLDIFIFKVSNHEIELNRKNIRGIIDSEFMATNVNKQSYFKPTVCAFGERFHTVFTRLPREYRPFLRIKGVAENLCSADIANCQPFLISLIINHPAIAKLIIPEFAPVLKKIAQLKLLTAIQFEEECSNGTIYEFWLKNRHDLKNREEAKNEFIKKILFSSENYNKKENEFAQLRFKTLFPDVASAISIMKNTNEIELPIIKKLFLNKKGKFPGKSYYHKTISCMCQRLESRIITGLIVPALIKQNLGPFLTVHDSIVIPESKAEQVKSTIINCFNKLGVKPPKVKTEVFESVL